MSTAYGLHCVTCAETSEMWWIRDYGRKTIERIVAAWPEISAAKAACPELEFDTMIKGYEEPSIFVFLGGALFGGEGDGHASHRLIVRDEFGKDYEELPKGSA